MKKILSFLLLLILFSGCAVLPPSEEDLAEQEKVRTTPVFIPLPEHVVYHLGLSDNPWAHIEQADQNSPFQYIVWSPPAVYIPIVGVFQEISYTNLVDISATKKLRKILLEKARDFYRDLDRPQSKNYDSYNNEYLWTSKPSRIVRDWENDWIESYARFSSVSGQIIQEDFLEDVNERMRKTPVPTLDIRQSKYESTRHYLHRAAWAKQELASYKISLSQAKNEAYRDVESREKLMICRLFTLFFGTPKITKIDYDPDSRLFGIEVGGAYGGGGVFHFMLADRIMNSEAPEYEKKIRRASVKVLLRVSGGNLFIDGGSLILPDGTMERILPFYEGDYQPKSVTVATLPEIKVPAFRPPRQILPNQRMKSEGEKILRDTVYFRGLQ